MKNITKQIIGLIAVSSAMVAMVAMAVTALPAFAGNDWLHSVNPLCHYLTYQQPAYQPYASGDAASPNDDYLSWDFYFDLNKANCDSAVASENRHENVVHVKNKTHVKPTKPAKPKPVLATVVTQTDVYTTHTPKPIKTTYNFDGMRHPNVNTTTSVNGNIQKTITNQRTVERVYTDTKRYVKGVLVGNHVTSQVIGAVRTRTVLSTVDKTVTRVNAKTGQTTVATSTRVGRDNTATISGATSQHQQQHSTRKN